MREEPAPIARTAHPAETVDRRPLEVALLTGGGDTSYAYGLATALLSQGVQLDLIAGESLDGPEFRGRPGVRFLNLHGTQRSRAPLVTKILTVLVYYARLLRYVRRARPRVLHILWNAKLEVVDRTLLMLYFKLLRKRVILTVHNVNAGWRDANDTALNRLTLRVQYRLADHLFVHTNRMKRELVEDFRVHESRITVIPFGMNVHTPHTALTPLDAKRRLDIDASERTLLFFGYIAPYKGLEFLVAAFERLVANRDDYRLIIAGKPKTDDGYWETVRRTISGIRGGRITLKIDFIPDNDVEVYFKAADVLIMPYTRIFQSGVLFLGYSFGLPAVVADVGSLSEDVVEGETGYVCRAGDSLDLARTLDRYFSSALFKDLPSRRRHIRDDAAQRHSWDMVGQVTSRVYAAVIDHHRA